MSSVLGLSCAMKSFLTSKANRIPGEKHQLRGNIPAEERTKKKIHLTLVLVSWRVT